MADAGIHPTDITYDDAVEAINIAIALGHPVPCFPGATYYQAHVWTWNEEERIAEDEVQLGIYASSEAAHIAVRNYAIEAWNDLGSHPLLHLGYDDEPDYSEFPDLTIIAAFYTASWVYSVDPVRMSSTPQRL